MEEPTKKRTLANGRRRQIVFLDPFSNPEQDAKTKRMRRTVKKWASINRDGLVGGRPSRCPQKSIDEAPTLVDEPLADHLTIDLAPNPPSGNLEDAQDGEESEIRVEQATTKQAPVREHSHPNPSQRHASSQTRNEGEAVSFLFSPNNDPFDALPFRSSSQVHDMLQMYMECRLVQVPSSAYDAKAYVAVARDRRLKWIDVALNSKAAYCALVAYFATAPGIPVDHKIADRYLGEALAAAAGDLADPETAEKPGILLAIVLLMAGAEHRQDTKSFKLHVQGASALSAFRQRKIVKPTTSHTPNRDTSPAPHTDSTSREPQRVRGLAELVDGIHPDDIITGTCSGVENVYDYEPQNCSREPRRQERIPNKSTTADSFYKSAEFPPDLKPKLPGALPFSGFQGLVEPGIISRAAWDAVLSYMIELSPLVHLARNDPAIGMASAHHLFIDGRPIDVVLEPFDITLYASIRICWHLMLWHNWYHPCLLVERKLHMVWDSLQRCDIESVLKRAPRLMMWIALMCGMLASGESAFWFADLMLLAKSYTRVKTFQGAINQIQDFVWKVSWNVPALRFWDVATSNEYLALRSGDGITDAASDQQNSAGVNNHLWTERENLLSALEGRAKKESSPCQHVLVDYWFRFPDNAYASDVNTTDASSDHTSRNEFGTGRFVPGELSQAGMAPAVSTMSRLPGGDEQSLRHTSGDVLQLHHTGRDDGMACGQKQNSTSIRQADENGVGLLMSRLDGVVLGDSLPIINFSRFRTR